MDAELKALGGQVKTLGGQTKISEAAIAVRDGDLKRAIELLTPILDNPDVPQIDRARAHGIMANAKKRLYLLDEEKNLLKDAVSHVDAAHKLAPDDYRYRFNRACYRWLLRNGEAIDDVFHDLEESLKKGLEFREIEEDEDLVELRKHERFPDWEASVRTASKRA